MKIEKYIYFEEGEKAKLSEIMSNNDDFSANLLIQEAFGLDIMQAQEVVEIYNKRIRK